jgi:hypothetical protein
MAGVIQRAMRDVKREERRRIAGSHFRGWMNIKLSCEKLAYVGFFPQNQSWPFLGKFRIGQYGRVSEYVSEH